MRRNLTKWVDCDKYREGGEGGLMYSPPAERGTAIIPVLEWLWDLPLSDVHLAYAHALNPTAIRICKSWPTDFRKGRITILADQYGILESIHQEVEVGYGSGEELQAVVKSIEEEEKRKWG